eukprot:scaffold61246_cov20-Tisochrysis_lutea.AAC.1
MGGGSAGLLCGRHAPKWQSGITTGCTSATALARAQQALDREICTVVKGLKRLLASSRLLCLLCSQTLPLDVPFKAHSIPGPGTQAREDTVHSPCSWRGLVPLLL